jgi:hypothetical protein
MHQDVTNLKSLFLSEEETMALLDLCLTSPSEMDHVKEQAVRKLTDLARRHLRASIAEEHEMRDQKRAETDADEAACELDGGPVAGDEPVSAITMLARSMARSHAPRRQMGTALADSRSRIRKIA